MVCVGYFGRIVTLVDTALDKVASFGEFTSSLCKGADVWRRCGGDCVV
jgi:hypothetical protein